MDQYGVGNFSECSTRERMQYGGKDAEKQAESYFKRHSSLFARYGWDGNNGYLPDGDYQQLPATIKMKPDYLVKQLGGDYSFVECKGCGVGGLKIKLSSIGAMKKWQEKAPVLLFVWNSSSKMFSFLTLNKLMELVKDLHVKRFPNDGREYFQVPCDRFNWQQP